MRVNPTNITQFCNNRYVMLSAGLCRVIIHAVVFWNCSCYQNNLTVQANLLLRTPILIVWYKVHSALKKFWALSNELVHTALWGCILKTKVCIKWCMHTLQYMCGVLIILVRTDVVQNYNQEKIDCADRSKDFFLQSEPTFISDHKNDLFLEF